MRNGSRRRCSGCVSTRVSFTPAPSDVGWPAINRSTERGRVTVSALWVVSVVVVIAFSIEQGQTNSLRYLSIRVAIALRRHRFLDLLVRGSNRRLLGVGAHRKTFGVYEADVGKAEEREYRLQIRHLRVRWGVSVFAAARQRYIHLLTFEQPFGSLLRVAKRHTGARNRVDPVLQRRRHAEVVHRDTEHNDVSGLNLRDQ